MTKHWRHCYTAEAATGGNLEPTPKYSPGDISTQRHGGGALIHIKAV